MRTNRSMSSCVLGALGLFLTGSVGALTPTAEADTLVVPDAYPTIQAAIDAAQEGDEVVIQPGIYNETFNFNGNLVALHTSIRYVPTLLSRLFVEIEHKLFLHRIVHRIAQRIVYCIA